MSAVSISNRFQKGQEGINYLFMDYLSNVRSCWVCLRVGKMEAASATNLQIQIDESVNGSWRCLVFVPIAILNCNFRAGACW